MAGGLIYKVGDRVTENKTGARSMTIIRLPYPVISHDGHSTDYKKYVCQWMEAGTLKFGAFQAEYLRKQNADKSAWTCYKPLIVPTKAYRTGTRIQTAANVALNCPAQHQFAAFLPDRLQRNKVDFPRIAGFFPKFA